VVDHPSVGGARIQVSAVFPSLADLKTFTTLNCCGTSVITTFTAQNTRGIFCVHVCPSEFANDQVNPPFNVTHLTPFCGRFCYLESVIDNNNALATGTGVLYDGAKIRAIASTLKYYTEEPLRLVCDPFACLRLGTPYLWIT